MGRTGFDYGDDRFDKDAVVSRFSYRTEDVPKLREFLAPGQYDVVVGNPPYITVKDKALNARYREIYHYCKGKYALTVPFMERFFQLAKPGERAGWVGQITSNSFMKREFGVPLIETILVRQRLTADRRYFRGLHPRPRHPDRDHRGPQPPHDPGHRPRCPRHSGRAGIPNNPAKGKVWTAIVEHVDQPGHEDQWISVTDLPRHSVAEHPWSLRVVGQSSAFTTER